MKVLEFAGLYHSGTWLSPGYVMLNEEGMVKQISGECPEELTIYESVPGLALPGFHNMHSHAFQYAMAGITERYQSGNENHNFWNWRDTMYAVANSMNPESLESVATMLYAEMLRFGYTKVTEFHYLHHDQSGHPYQNKAELGGRLINAAKAAGMDIVLVPIFYQTGGFSQPAGPHQRRFISKDFEDYLHLWEATENVCQMQDHVTIEAGFHSLRAVHVEQIKKTMQCLEKDLPVHLHISEQLLEVQQSEQILGKRPVAYLDQEIGLNKNFNLVHATHINQEESDLICRSAANVILCPTTEANLGDGLFPFASFQSQMGRWSIGSDSHICINPIEEIRLLDYGQRLTTHYRHTFKSNSGIYGLEKAMENCLESSSGFQEGKYFDALVIDENHPLIGSAESKNKLPAIIYCGDTNMILGTIKHGNWIVQKNEHRHASIIRKKFYEVIKALGIR